MHILLRGLSVVVVSTCLFACNGPSASPPNAGGDGGSAGTGGTAGTAGGSGTWGGPFFDAGLGGVGGFAGVGGASGYYAAPPSDGESQAGTGVDVDAGVVAQPAEVANPFVATTHDPFSTFAADVDTASYDTFVQMLSYGTLPAADTVRVEDFVNYFDYAYPTPSDDAEHPFTISLAAAPHPSGRGTEVLRVGIQASAPVREKQPANLVFLVDVSGSMSDADKLPLVKVLLRETLDVLDATDTVSLVTYAGRVRVALSPTAISQRSVIEAAIAGLESGGSTNGAGGIQLAYEQAQDGWIEGGINHVLLCTDGDFNVGISDPTQLGDFIAEKRETGITLTAIGFGRSRYGDETMETLSNRGDGIYGVVYSEDQAIEYANERMLSTLIRVAKDMKIQVEMNPALVQAYRLIGYENRAIADVDFRNDVVDAGDIGSGHRVTAIYEIVRVGGVVPMPSGAPVIEDGASVDGVREIGVDELVRVKVRYKKPGALVSDPAFEVAQSLLPNDVFASAAEAGEDFRWAVAVATLAEILRGSPFSSRDELTPIGEIINAQSERDTDRGELSGLIAQTQQLLQ